MTKITITGRQKPAKNDAYFAYMSTYNNLRCGKPAHGTLDAELNSPAWKLTFN